MKKIFFIFLLFSLNKLFAQTIIQRDPEIEQMVKEISADSLQSYIKTLVAFGTRNSLSTQTNPRRGIGAARTWLLKRFNEFAKQSNGRLSVINDTITIQPDKKRVDTMMLVGNVMATLKGSDPNDKRIFIISGHLDTRRINVLDRINDAPGANDDGSGTAAVMECARVMSKHSFPATIIFVSFSGHEQVLYGSIFMSEKAKREHWNVEAVINNDIMGSNNSNETNIMGNTKVRVFSEGLPAYETEKNAVNIRDLGLENDGRARQLARYIKETGERYIDNLEVVLIYRNDRFLRGGDHRSFVERGFAAVRITETNENYTRQHEDVRVENGIQYGDLLEYIDFEYLRKNTGLNLSTLANLAKSPAMPDSVKMDVKILTNSTYLYWQAPTVGKIKGYYILIRETTSPVWQKKIFTTATEMRLPYSKDNYFFAVQSVNGSGNESLPVVPGIGR